MNQFVAVAVVEKCSALFSPPSAHPHQTATRSRPACRVPARVPTLRLPRSLQEAVERLSREDRTSINQFVAVAVVEKVSALETAELFADRRAGAASAGAGAGALENRKHAGCPYFRG
jgi:hypothetical protein